MSNRDRESPRWDPEQYSNEAVGCGCHRSTGVISDVRSLEGALVALTGAVRAEALLGIATAISDAVVSVAILTRLVSRVDCE